MARFARYDLLQKISGSGMSESWTATAFHKDGSSVDVVLKRILPEAVDPAMQEKLLEDVEAAVAIEHANAARIFECGWIDDSSFVTTERVQGIDARTLLERRGSGAAVPPRVALHIATCVLQALHHAHRRTPAVLHRDVSPANVLLSVGGQVKLAGFGIAPTRERSGRRRDGRARYVSPEQERGEKLDGRSDLYSTGLVLHELLTGHPVFFADARLDAPIPWPSSVSLGVPAELDALVLALCEPELGKRFASGLDAVEAIARWGRDRGLVLREDGLAEMVAEHATPPAPATPLWRIVQSAEKKGRAVFATDDTFRAEPARAVDPRRVAERVTRESTDPTVSAMRDLDMADGEEHTRPQWESIQEVRPDPGEITREGTREFPLEPALVGAVGGAPERAFEEPPTVTRASVDIDAPTRVRPAVKPPAKSANAAVLIVALAAVLGVMVLGAIVCVVSYWFFVSAAALSLN